MRSLSFATALAPFSQSGRKRQTPRPIIAVPCWISFCAQRFSVLFLFFCRFSALWFIALRSLSAPCGSVFFVLLLTLDLLKRLAFQCSVLHFCRVSALWFIDLWLDSRGTTPGGSAPHCPVLAGSSPGGSITAIHHPVVRSLRFHAGSPSAPSGSVFCVSIFCRFSALWFIALLDHCSSSPCVSNTAVPRWISQFSAGSALCGSSPCSITAFHHHVAQSLRFQAGFH